VGTRNRTLVVVRHAKAEPFGEEDHERRLTERGHRDAAEAGAWLAAQGIVPTHAMVSSAARAKATWESLAEGAGGSAVASYEDGLYSAGPDAALEVLRTAEPEAKVLVFVGHNPTAAYLAHMLSDGTPDPDAFRAMSEGFPTAALAVFEVHVDWADLSEGSASVTHFHVGKG
jgi:phosphohistidine phosphatase